MSSHLFRSTFVQSLFHAGVAVAILGWAAESEAGRPFGVKLTPIGTHTNGPPYNTSAAEIVAHEPATQRLYVVNAQGTRIDYAGGFAFPIDTSKATTNVLVTNGSTVVLGGLLQAGEGWTENRIPWISKVPVLGSLFKSTSVGPEGKIELLIFLTPTILEEARVS